MLMSSSRLILVYVLICRLIFVSCMLCVSRLVVWCPVFKVCRTDIHVQRDVRWRFVVRLVVVLMSDEFV